MNEATSREFDTGTSWKILFFNTLAFTICFAAWMMNGVLITFLVDNDIYDWGPVQMSWLIAIPVLTGAVFRLPLGVATDKYGGRLVYGLLLIFSAIPMFLVSRCDSFSSFALAGLGFGFTGTSFAIGIAYTSVWFSKSRQGTALGIFGAGNAGAALTAIFAPQILTRLTNGGENLEGWRTLPVLYAALLVVMGILFLLLTEKRLPVGSASKNLKQRLEPLRHARVWRFGLYYFFVFGGFVALAQWLIPYYVNAYGMTVAMAGLLTAVNTLPSGIIRALGGWMSDKFGARGVMYWVFGVCFVCCALMIVPQMDIRSPGSGIMAKRAGTVTAVDPSGLTVDTGSGETRYALKGSAGPIVSDEERRSSLLIWPRSQFWQEPVVEVGQEVKKRQLVARGVTEIFFQANVWVFTSLSLILGATMGIGKAAVYKHIPDYFPEDVGVVGGIVGVLGGLGGFVFPIVFGYLLRSTGLWTSCWMVFLVIVAISLGWMHIVVRRIMRAHAPEVISKLEDGAFSAPVFQE
ncbi:MAG: NarK/NasA family nitrate transporter [bacterium]|nr:NarK/NasA family nitrate transporter [bacterium]